MRDVSPHNKASEEEERRREREKGNRGEGELDHLEREDWRCGGAGREGAKEWRVGR